MKSFGDPWGIGLAFIINIAAGIALFALTTRLDLALAVVVVLQFVLIGYLLLGKRGQLTRLGIAQVYKDVDSGPRPAELVDEVTTSFLFVGISAKSLLISEGFVTSMIQKARGSCTFRFLILHPNSEFVAHKALEEGDTADSWRHEIQASIDRLLELKTRHDLSVSVRVIDARPTVRAILLNGTEMLVSWYPVGHRGTWSRLLRVQSKPGSIFELFFAQAETAWSAGTEWVG